MPVPKKTIWELDPHTTAKHEILRRYLKAWFPILSSWHSRIIYIDGFSGPGRYKNSEPGSPLIALDVAANHRRKMSGELIFWFIDERSDRIENLKEELKNFSFPSHFKVKVECGLFHEKLGWVLECMEENKTTLAPTFAFIDPFGFSGIPFKLIECLLKQEKCEVFITFMVDAINRFLEHPQDKIVQYIVEAFGTEEAIRIAESSGDRITNLRTLYQQQLRKVAKFVRYFEMRDRQNRTQYYLFFATNNELGHLKMKEAMWGVDPDGEFRFSDATDPNQLVLFENDPTSALTKNICNRFRGKTRIPIQLVRKYTENDTPYLKKHMTPVLRKAEEIRKIKIEPLKTDGKKRIARTYPDNALITIL
ncbi:MAG: hypothetical protein A2W61_01205 [Deltaproteobacteria bacterium RIFCSPLOWO2_01_44_7]|nr:MAG: hypothetical protein A3D98_03570 [Deltaproteobacteria bacterium RIFCSPHIGHO2_12_FULL_44_21]OGQ30681.1 MAG: hypothetical protein A2979_05995 [Deltaproteobacteria bacterium RIFCSPLOWO2_01_FULL_45_74]OGQ37730.1 MAG: hypothetical protein A2W61_01205 [Deltaproteobacteria bacterium RIFCSPLOWO2_01_44_7]